MEKKKKEIEVNGSFGRILFATTVWITTLAVTILVVRSISELLDYTYAPYGAVVGFAVWMGLFSRTLNYFVVSPPEVSGLITINLLKNGLLRPYSSGLHIKYPWEQVKEGNYINLRLVEETRTETYPAKDGPEMKGEWFFQYRPSLPLLGRYIAVSEETIKQGIARVGSSILSHKIAHKRAEECKTEQEELEKALKAEFEKPVIILQEAGLNLGAKIPEIGMVTLAYLYGIELIQVRLDDLDYGEKYQRARASKAVADKLNEIATNLKRGDISEKEALNTAMIINKDISKNVQENIQEIKGAGMEAVASFFMALAQGKGGEKK